MTVKIRLLGVFRGLSGRGLLNIELEKPISVCEMITRLIKLFSPKFKQAVIDPELDDPRPNAIILVNGKEISVLKGLETKVRDGDEVVLIPTLHGG